MKNLFKMSLMLGAMAIALSSCNCLRKMNRKVNQIQASCAPQVLVKKGSTVNADVTVSFPAKYFNDNAVVKVTPVLVNAQGETLAGTPKFLQGKSVRDNYTVIDWKEGGSYSQSISFPYDAKFGNSTLELQFEAKCSNACGKKGKEYSKFVTIPVAVGISNLSDKFDYVAMMEVIPDNFQRVTSVTENADLIFVINSSNVRTKALSTDGLATLKQFVVDNSSKDRTTVSPVYSKGYASPDGPLGFNDKLAKSRSESAQKAVAKKYFDKDKTAKYDISSYGEDWNGFKELVEKSNIQDKDLILQVLQMYSDPVKRDQEIKNMSGAFKVLEKEVLPKLRRAVISSTAETSGKTDQEILAAAKSNPSSLSVEEVLYAAKLMGDDNAGKVKMFGAVAAKLDDPRVYNNYGVALANTGDFKGANDQFAKAVKSKDSRVTDNMGYVAVASGDVDRGVKSLSSSSSDNAKATVAFLNGDYNKASQGMKSNYNKAVTALCNNDLAAASKALANDNSAKADYLKAIIAARQGDSKAAVANLKTACAKEPAMKAKALNDVEFAKIPEVKTL